MSQTKKASSIIGQEPRGRECACFQTGRTILLPFPISIYCHFPLVLPYIFLSSLLDVFPPYVGCPSTGEIGGMPHPTVLEAQHFLHRFQNRLKVRFIGISFVSW